MHYSIFSEKIAFDRNGKRIGKLIEKQITTDQISVIKRSLFGRSITVISSLKDVLKENDEDLWLNIVKAEFDLFVKRKQAQIRQIIKFAKFDEASGTDKAAALSFHYGNF